MASLASPAHLALTQRLIPRIGLSWPQWRPSLPESTRLLTPSAHTTAAASYSALALGISTGLLHDLLDTIWRAVPKKKTTHSKTRMRSATKGLKDKLNINNCSACGQPKLANVLCGNCFKELRQRWAKEASSAAGITSA